MDRLKVARADGRLTREKLEEHIQELEEALAATGVFEIPYDGNRLIFRGPILAEYIARLKRLLREDGG